MTEDVVKNNMREEAMSEESRIGAEPDTLESLQKALADEKERAQKHLASWQRAQADFSNFKKRNEQEKAETIKFANTALISGLLPALDDLERALDNGPSEIAGSNWVEGIEMIYRKLLAALEGQGLSRIEAEGKDFDPNFHQAVLHEEGGEGKVIGELQKGYMLRDRLLRPAMVKVGKGKSKDR